MARTAPVAASIATTAPWLTPAARPGPASSASIRASAAACRRVSIVVRSSRSAVGGARSPSPSRTQSANQPASREGAGGKCRRSASTTAWAAVSAPVSIMASSTSTARPIAAEGLTRGLKREGALGSPASTAAWPGVRRRASMPKNCRAAASTPKVPAPR